MESLLYHSILHTCHRESKQQASNCSYHDLHLIHVCAMNLFSMLGDQTWPEQCLLCWTRGEEILGGRIIIINISKGRKLSGEQWKRRRSQKDEAKESGHCHLKVFKGQKVAISMTTLLRPFFNTHWNQTLFTSAKFHIHEFFYTSKGPLK